MLHHPSYHVRTEGGLDFIFHFTFIFDIYITLFLTLSSDFFFLLDIRVQPPLLSLPLLRGISSFFPYGHTHSHSPKTRALATYIYSHYTCICYTLLTKCTAPILLRSLHQLHSASITISHCSMVYFIVYNLAKSITRYKSYNKKSPAVGRQDLNNIREEEIIVHRRRPCNEAAGYINSFSRQI